MLLGVLFGSGCTVPEGSLPVGRIPGSGVTSGKLSRVRARNPLAPGDTWGDFHGENVHKYKNQKAFK